MADGLYCPESNNRCCDNWQLHLSSSGSENMACNESDDVNVGDPIDPHRTRVSANKYKSEDAEKVLIGSQIERSTPSLGKPSTWGRFAGNFNSNEET